MARPSDYTLELGDIICERIADGQSLRTVCTHEDMPSKATVFRWLRTDEKFRDQYDLSTAARTEAFVEELTDISDDDALDVQRARLMVDTRKWIASKLKSKKYGDKIEQTHQGPGGGPVMISSVDGDL